MEEELLWLYSCHKASINKPASSGLCVEWNKTRQRLARDHYWWPLAFQLDLSKQTRDLHSINSGSLRTRLYHQLKIVVWKFTNQTCRKTYSEKQNTVIYSNNNGIKVCLYIYPYLLISLLYESKHCLYCLSIIVLNLGLVA